MHQRASHCILVVLFCLLTEVLYADRPVRVLYYQAPPDAPGNAYIYAGPTRIGQTKLPRHNFSDTIQIPNAKGKIRLSFLATPPKEGDEPPQNAPSVLIPGRWEKILLLVSEDKDNSTLPIKIRAINASNNAFGPGSIYMMNLSRLRIGGTIGDKKIDLLPRTVQIIKNPISTDGLYPAKLYTIRKRGDKPQRFIKQMWGHDSKVRKVLFILPRPAPHHATYYCAPIHDF
ncbi:MAG: hypothetical protein H7A51_17170 [Akkermansiaceae bacterium]|nr:hypothetical protein [Akkermansiaceae bacterium]